jgi:DNA invertase Pin-like site-specific DNA recombinase
MEHRRFVAYYRVSTKQQGQSGLGLEAQEVAVLRHICTGDKLVASFTDVESGTRKGNKRPELAKALAACRRERATLLIAKLDRLARNVAFVSNLMEAGVDFVAVDMPTANRLTIHILAAVAEAEAEAISSRTKAALAAAKARGTRLGAVSNLTLAGGIAGAATTRRAAAEYYARVAHVAAGMRQRGANLTAIAAHLNALGELTREGRPFTRDTIRRILARASG